MLAQLQQGVTTLAWCWRIERRDGFVLAVTDHDQPIAFQGASYSPGDGLAQSPMRAEAGLAPSRGAVFGAITSDRIRAADIDNGLWDGAQVTLHRVDWTTPERRFQVFLGEFGEITRTLNAFEVELNGPSARLNRMIGRVFAKRCDAELGDDRCGVDLTDERYRAEGEVSWLWPNGSFSATGLYGFAEGWFAHGRLTWVSGANTAALVRVDAHAVPGDDVQLKLAAPPAAVIALGDRFVVTAGCDKRLSSCSAKFSNAERFRGCPFLPGNDRLLRHAGAPGP